MLVREDDCLHPVAQPELHQDPGYVRLHGRLADERLLGELRIREPACEVTESSSRGVSSSSSSDGFSAPSGGRRTNSSITLLVIEGARSASPEATERMPTISCSGGTSLSRKPLAPARSAS